MAVSRRKELFPEVTDAQWNDWKWQVRNRIETLEKLKKYIKLSKEEEEGIRKSLKTIRMATSTAIKRSAGFQLNTSSASKRNTPMFWICPSVSSRSTDRSTA